MNQKEKKIERELERAENSCKIDKEENIKAFEAHLEKQFLIKEIENFRNALKNQKKKFFQIRKDFILHELKQKSFNNEKQKKMSNSQIAKAYQNFLFAIEYFAIEIKSKNFSQENYEYAFANERIANSAFQLEKLQLIKIEQRKKNAQYFYQLL